MCCLMAVPFCFPVRASGASPARRVVGGRDGLMVSGNIRDGVPYAKEVRLMVESLTASRTLPARAILSLRLDARSQTAASVCNPTSNLDLLGDASPIVHRLWLGAPCKGWRSPQSHNDTRPDDRLPRSVRVQMAGELLRRTTTP